jgi:hypothetical protein
MEPMALVSGGGSTLDVKVLSKISSFEKKPLNGGKPAMARHETRNV